MELATPPLVLALSESEDQVLIKRDKRDEQVGCMQFHVQEMDELQTV